MASPLSLPQHGSVEIDGRATPYRVRRSRRSRHAALHIHPRSGLEVVIPTEAPDGLVDELLHEKRDWLRRHALELQRAQHSSLPLQSGKLLPLRGEWYPLRISPPSGTRARTPSRANARSRAARVRFDGATIAVATREPSGVAAALERWYRRQARRVLLDRIAALRAPNDPPVRRLAVRDQGTRWGSCSSAGTLSFNWRLIMAPPDVLDAVVVHELVHLTIGDHSDRFWSALQTRFPRHKTCRRWLDANAYRLGF